MIQTEVNQIHICYKIRETDQLIKEKMNELEFL